jgi:alanyl-tRNA synthetase
MSGNEVRKRFLAFLEKNGHAVIPSSALVPEKDPTTLFTGSGMQPLIPYLMGEAHPMGVRLANSQKCFRAEDIEEVGDNRHTTFFEMLGNWSLGDYFKKEQLRQFFTFLTDEVGLDPVRIYVSVFAGDESLGIPRDDDSVAIWKELFAEKGIEAQDVFIGSEEDGYKVGMQGGRIFYYDASKNWWSRSGKPAKMPTGEIGGPDSEVFYDFGPEYATHPQFKDLEPHPNSDSGQFLEIGNSVFIEYIKNEDGSFSKLPQRNVDFGGGLERIVAARVGNPDIFTIDLLWNVVSQIEEISGKKYTDNLIAFRVITDHIRGAVFMIGDGVMPGNSEQGYFVRRLLRRSVRYADMLGIGEGKLKELATSVIETYKDHYANLADKKDEIVNTIAGEEEQFRRTLANGLKEFNKTSLRILATTHIDEESSKKVLDPTAKGEQYISGARAFELFTTYGFPIELTIEIAKERGLDVDLKKFEALMDEHREKSRAGAEQKFKGGLADASEETTRLHTTHHLLLAALQEVLGEHVHQKGSNITAERLRIDFSHDAKMTDEQKIEVEKIVNEKIDAELPVVRSTLPKEEAEKLGAEHEFNAKYPDLVSVYSIGPVGATLEAPQFESAFSIEFCGGPHVENTREIKKSGRFRIAKEEASSSGVRRIKGVLE